MSKKFSYIAVIAVGVVISTAINMIAFAPKKASAAFNYQRRSCTSVQTTNGSMSSPTSSGMDTINTETHDFFIKVSSAWTRCPTGQVMTAVRFSKLNGGSTAADGIQLDIECCEVAV
jgi:hypothetical protein